MFKLIKKISGKLDYWNRKIVLFQWTPNNQQTLNNQELTYSEIKESSDAIFKQSLFSINECETRFAHGHVLCVLKNTDAVVVAYGWLNNSGQHYLGELNLKMILPKNTTVLYDFFTFEAYRGRGYYAELLQCICARDAKAKLIYALASNTQSCNGILKAHFKLMGTISGFNKNKYLKIIAQ